MSAHPIGHGGATANGVRLHYRHAGQDGPPVALLHGFPQTSHEWRHVIPLLAGAHRVVAPDLRGLGDSERAAGGYDKRTAGFDVLALMQALGHERFHLVGHDIGGQVAYALAAACPEAVLTLTVMDTNLAGFGLEQATMDFTEPGRGFWHFPFNMAPDISEALVEGRERTYIAYQHRVLAGNPGAVTPADIDEYVRCYSQPGGMRAGFAHYRAMYQDADDNRASAARLLAMPVLAIGAERGAGIWVAESLQQVANDVTPVVLPGCGHWIPEEQPDVLAGHLLPFFARAA